MIDRRKLTESEYEGDAIMEVLSDTYGRGDAIYDYFKKYSCC